jgi:Fe2+ transport system protein FeoA/rubredoxin
MGRLMKEFSCTVCGHIFDPLEQTACQSCPIYQGCAMVCCPACGFTTLDHNQSSIVRWIHRFSKRGNGIRLEEPTTTLNEMPPGTLARVSTFLNMGKSQVEIFQAYGLAPGRWIRVLQQKPVTLVDLGNIELALEGDLAEKIVVDHTSTQSEAASS